VSDIFKKITSIEPDDEAALKALKITPDDTRGVKKNLFRPIDDDPVPEFITRKKPAEELSIPEPEKIMPVEPAAQSIPTDIAIANTSEPNAGWVNWVCGLAIIIWLGASFAYIYGVFDLGHKWADITPMQLAGIILAVLFPALLIGLLFYTLRQLTHVSNQALSLNRMANTLTRPDESVIAKTAIMSQAVKSEIDGVDARIDQALARMIALENVIKKQNAEINAATAAATQTTDNVTSRLSTQRLAMESIASTFDERMALLTTTLAEQSNKLEASTQTAEQKIQEARVSIDGAAEKINAASDVVRGNTIKAASTLTKSHEEIESLAEMMRARSAELDEVYRKHAQDLTTMIGKLRDEQQEMSISLEERLVKMRDMSLSAKVSAESLTEASESGRKTVEALAEATRLTDTAVKQRFTEMEEMVKFSGEKAETITDRATRRVQSSLSHTRKEIARIENDMAALQMRLSAPQIEQTLDLDEPEQPKPKRRGRIQLKPLDEDFPSIEAPRPPEEAESLTLRPAPEAIIETISPLHEAIPDELDEDFSIPDMDDNLTVAIEPLDLITPDPDADIKNYIAEPLATDTTLDQSVMRPATESKSLFGNKRKKKKSGWHWRDMLGGLDRPDDTSAIDALTHSDTSPDAFDARIKTALTELGLAPAAIVDDGCIIEAANTRKSKGAIAMSQAVAKRMGDPVRHLHRAMEENTQLKTEARAFVAQYQARMDIIETDREAIRTKLESDAGRAFLLCDAALNG